VVGFNIGYILHQFYIFAAMGKVRLQFIKKTVFNDILGDL
jgi:hypothetical protein